MSTTLMPELAISSIIAHPKNPRHNAVADDDMVASVREHGLVQPVVVAPHPDKAGKYVPIAGHRRIDAAKKAKHKTVPAILRTDLVSEGQQIEAMIIENGHRLDLTPIEEAEGYAQLELLGYKPAAIAAAVGRNVTTVRARLKLLKLSPSTQTKVHAGQLSIDDAAAFTEFAGDAEATKRLEKAAASGQLRYELTNMRQRRDRLQENAALVAQLIDAGATEYTLPADTALWQVTSGADATMRSVRVRSGFEDWAAHEGHLAYHQTDNNWPTVTVLCADPAAHATDEAEETRDAERASWEAQQAQNRAEREEREAAAESAAVARTAAVLDLVGNNTPLAPQLRDLLRVLLPQTLWRGEDFGMTRRYQEAMNIPEADRWDGETWGPSPMTVTLFAQHVGEINRYSDGILVRALLAVLIADAEVNIGGAEGANSRLARNYYELLAEAGHTLTPPDEAFLAELDEVETNRTEAEKAAS